MTGIKDKQPYVTIMHSIGGIKAVLLKWYDDINDYDAFMTGPGMKTSKQARQYAKDWAEAEGIEYRP